MQDAIICDHEKAISLDQSTSIWCLEDAVSLAIQPSGDGAPIQRTSQWQVLRDSGELYARRCGTRQAASVHDEHEWPLVEKPRRCEMHTGYTSR